MGEVFTPEEQEILKSFVTNLDKPIFVLKNLPEVIKGALFSRYSRSKKSLRRLLLDEFILDKDMGIKEMIHFQQGQEQLDAATQKAHAFYDRVLDGYGDDSVGELGGAHIACEQVSNMASKVLEDARIGGSPLEKSTRYVYFDVKVDGDYQFYKEPVLLQSPFAELYLKTNRILFDAYAKLIEPMRKFLAERMPLEQFSFFDAQVKQTVSYPNITDETLLKRAQLAYTSALRAKTCDILRGLLPAATLTNVGIFGNGRFFQGLLTKMYCYPLQEMRDLSQSMHQELNQVIPSFVRRAKADPFLIETAAHLQRITQSVTAQHRIQPAEPVELIEYEQDAEAKVVAALLYASSKLPLKQLRALVAQMTPEQRLQVIEAHMQQRTQRRNKPFRAYEQVYYTFDLLGDYGIYRDLQRHRILTQERQDLTVIHGYETPEELVAAGLDEEYHECMIAAADAFHTIAKQYPKEAQYVVPFAYRIRWHMKMNLREAFHFCELRSGQQGHPGYRKIAQVMAKKIAAVHPTLAAAMKFVDYNEYKLERINAEMKKEEKREQWNQA